MAIYLLKSFKDFEILKIK